LGIGGFFNLNIIVTFMRRELIGDAKKRRNFPIFIHRCLYWKRLALFRKPYFKTSNGFPLGTLVANLSGALVLPF
jgi:hypothetical protein